MKTTNLRDFLQHLHKNLNPLREREAKHNSNAPLDLFSQIENHQTVIALTAQAIAGREVVIYNCHYHGQANSTGSKLPLFWPRELHRPTGDGDGRVRQREIVDDLCRAGAGTWGCLSTPPFVWIHKHIFTRKGF